MTQVDKKKLNGVLEEAYNSTIRIDAEREQLKAIKERLVDEFGLSKKIAAKVIHYYCKGDLDEDVAVVNEVESLLDKE